MKIEGFGIQLPSPLQPPKNKNEVNETFGNALTELIKTVNDSQQESQKAIQDFVSGNGVELHEVMIAGEKAKTNLELLMEIRNKAIDMFKELTRIPV